MTLTTYQPSTMGVEEPAQYFDEVMTAGGEIAASWRYLLDSIAGIGNDGMRERQNRAMRLLQDDGATYQIYSRSSQDKSWRMDLVPWLINSEDWQGIESGLQERAALFDLILKDIYGSRSLVKRGILPAELLFSHKGFLRSCDGIAVQGDHQLIVHAVDMMRGSDGLMCVLADRTQAPSGFGYALENRTVMNQVFPSLFRDSHVHRLANFFHGLRQKLVSLAPWTHSPQLAILSPGPYNETYFEHAYLAKYMGMHLVQSADLEVQRNRLFMKTLTGHKRIDVLMRRVDDVYCDPVELRGDSELGIPGLLEVARSGNVAIANPLGSGILESPALLRYLPEISDFFFGRSLKLKTVKTWWCGDKNDLQEVADRFDSLVIKRTNRMSGSSSVVVSECSEEQRDRLLKEIMLKPFSYVAQEKLVPSHVPVIDKNQWSSRPVLLRGFASASDKSYRVMPGGLTRVGFETGSSLISSQLGAVSKDTWVLASEPEKQVELWPDRPREEQMLDELATARTIENLFWFARYGERSELLFRLLRSVTHQVFSELQPHDRVRNRLLEALTVVSHTWPGFMKTENGEVQEEQEILSLVFDEDSTGSIRYNSMRMLDCAEGIKELMSGDCQRLLNEIVNEWSRLTENRHALYAENSDEVINGSIFAQIALSGAMQDSMIRGVGWQFYMVGRYLERALLLISLLRTTIVDALGQSDQAVLIRTLLSATESMGYYRLNYGDNYNVRNVLEYAAFGSTNPHSLIFYLDQMEMLANKLPAKEDGRKQHNVFRSLFEAVHVARLTDLKILSGAPELADGDSHQRTELAAFLGRIESLLLEFSESLGERYFVSSRSPHQLLDLNWIADS